jgi:sterol desaturase/sphingolipid hydroxylase (fatty acid hydroxylase superfamily)
MHRIHHSVLREEHDRNFGFNASWWDRLFGSYRDAPSQPQAGMPLGLSMFRDDEEQRFLALMMQPVRPLSPQSAEPSSK